MRALIGKCQGGCQISMIRNATLAISNMCRGKNPPPDFDSIKMSLPVLANMLRVVDDPESLGYIAWSLSYMADDNSSSNYRINAVISAGVLPGLIGLLDHAALDVAVPALRAVGNVIAGDDVHTRLALDSGVMPHLKRLLTHPRQSVRREACWAISNTTDHLTFIIDHEIVPRVIHILRNDRPEVAKQAVWILGNATNSATPAQMNYLFDHGVHSVLLDMMLPSNARVDEEVPRVASDGVLAILECGDRIDSRSNPYVSKMISAGAIDRLNDAKRHSNSTVRSTADKIIRKYFQNAANEQERVDPKEIDPKAE